MNATKVTVPTKLPKGKPLALVMTSGVNQGDNNLYDLVGLSVGKVLAIKHALGQLDSPVGNDIVCAIDRVELPY